MNNQERKEVFSQYPTNQMVEIESPNVDKTKEKQDRKNDLFRRQGIYLFGSWRFRNTIKKRRD